MVTFSGPTSSGSRQPCRPSDSAQNLTSCRRDAPWRALRFPRDGRNPSKPHHHSGRSAPQLRWWRPGSACPEGRAVPSRRRLLVSISPRSLRLQALPYPMESPREPRLSCSPTSLLRANTGLRVVGDYPAARKWTAPFESRVSCRLPSLARSTTGHRWTVSPCLELEIRGRRSSQRRGPHLAPVGQSPARPRRSWGRRSRRSSLF